MPKPILVLDDEEKFATMLQELLADCGYEADYCLDPQEALERLNQQNFQLVITDYMMPQMDGSQFLQAARRINPDLPVIMISGLMNMPELIKVANIGVTLVLEKPFNTGDLLEQVARFVEPSAGEKAAAMAMDMEASEISFSPEEVETSYPVPVLHLSDASNENKRFLQTLWKAAGTCRHLPFFAQRGAEVRLLASEIMGWTGQDGEVVRIDISDTDTSITRDWAREVDPFPGALLVDLRGAEWNEATRTKLVDWIDFIETCGKDVSCSRFLYILPTGARFEVDKLELPKCYQPLVATDTPVLLSLRERLMDTATYLSRLLDPSHKALLGREGLVRLLHYGWPGGYQELNEKLAAIRKRLESGGRVSDQELQDLLRDDSEDTGSLTAGLDLVSYLKRRQREYIHLHREPGEDLKDTVLRLGIDSDAVSVEDVLNGSALAFPSVGSNYN